MTRKSGWTETGKAQSINASSLSSSSSSSSVMNVVWVFVSEAYLSRTLRRYGILEISFVRCAQVCPFWSVLSLAFSLSLSLFVLLASFLAPFPTRDYSMPIVMCMYVKEIRIGMHVWRDTNISSRNSLCQKFNMFLSILISLNEWYIRWRNCVCINFLCRVSWSFRQCIIFTPTAYYWKCRDWKCALCCAIMAVLLKLSYCALRCVVYIYSRGENLGKIRAPQKRKRTLYDFAGM